MRFDSPLTAFALESSGAAARALGISHTLTLSAPPAADAEPAPLVQAVAAQRIQVPREAPPSLTLTL